MNLSIKQKNVFTEVHTILEHLEEEELKKIPKNVFSTIEKNRNLDYKYEINDDIDLSKQPMSPETRALLFNIYRDYLATPEQKQKIISYQASERMRNEKKKMQKYNQNNIFKSSKEVINKDKLDRSSKEQAKCENKSIVAVKENNLIKRIISKIKSIFKV